VPGVSYYNFIQSNGQTVGGGSNWNSTSYLAGNVSLLKNWSTSQLALNYSGGGDFSTDSSVGNGWFQQLGASQTFNWRRWQLTVLDEFAYLPQSQFGFGAGTGLALPGIGGSLGPGSTGLGGGLDPGPIRVLRHWATVHECVRRADELYADARSSITFGGIDSILRFTDPGNVESDDYVGNLGYNYQVTREDTLGIVYRYSSFTTWDFRRPSETNPCRQRMEERSPVGWPCTYGWPRNYAFPSATNSRRENAVCCRDRERDGNLCVRQRKQHFGELFSRRDDG